MESNWVFLGKRFRVLFGSPIKKMENCRVGISLVFGTGTCLATQVGIALHFSGLKVGHLLVQGKNIVFGETHFHHTMLPGRVPHLISIIFFLRALLLLWPLSSINHQNLRMYLQLSKPKRSVDGKIQEAS